MAASNRVASVEVSVAGAGRRCSEVGLGTAAGGAVGLGRASGVAVGGATAVVVATTADTGGVGVRVSGGDAGTAVAVADGGATGETPQAAPVATSAPAKISS